MGCDTSDPTGGGTGITQADLDALASAFGCSVVAISVGPPRNGSLSDDDCTHPNDGDQSKIDYFGFRLSQNMSIVIDYESSDYDAYLYLYDSNGQQLASDDDSGGDLDSRISRTLNTGVYAIGANSVFTTTDLGSYTMRLSN